MTPYRRGCYVARRTLGVKLADEAAEMAEMRQMLEEHNKSLGIYPQSYLPAEHPVRRNPRAVPMEPVESMVQRGAMHPLDFFALRKSTHPLELAALMERVTPERPSMTYEDFLRQQRLREVPQMPPGMEEAPMGPAPSLDEMHAAIPSGINRKQMGRPSVDEGVLERVRAAGGTPSGPSAGKRRPNGETAHAAPVEARMPPPPAAAEVPMPAAQAAAAKVPMPAAQAAAAAEAHVPGAPAAAPTAQATPASAPTAAATYAAGAEAGTNALAEAPAAAGRAVDWSHPGVKALGALGLVGLGYGAHRMFSRDD